MKIIQHEKDLSKIVEMINEGKDIHIQWFSTRKEINDENHYRKTRETQSICSRKCANYSIEKLLEMINMPESIIVEYVKD